MSNLPWLLSHWKTLDIDWHLAFSSSSSQMGLSEISGLSPLSSKERYSNGFSANCFSWCPPSSLWCSFLDQSHSAAYLDLCQSHDQDENWYIQHVQAALILVVKIWGFCIFNLHQWCWGYGVDAYDTGSELWYPAYSILCKAQSGDMLDQSND